MITDSVTIGLATRLQISTPITAKSSAIHRKPFTIAKAKAKNADTNSTQNRQSRNAR